MEQQKEPKVWEGTVLTVPNRHYECCGKPPELVAGSCYTAYFENDYGEQIVFQFNYKERKGFLWHGDWGWGDPIPVMGGGSTMVMSDEEREWLRLVWRVATSRQSKEFQVRSLLDLVNAQKAIFDDLLARPEFAKDDSWRRSFIRQKKKMEKQEKDLTDQLVQVQIEEANKEEGKGNDERE